MTNETAEEYDTLIQWALASITVGERAVEMGLATSDDVWEDSEAARGKPLLGQEAIWQKTSLPLRWGGYGLASAVDTRGAAYLGARALVLAKGSHCVVRD